MNRRERIEDFVTSSRAELQLGGLSDRAIGATVQQWDDRLRWIPDEYLDECYRLAMDNHGTRSPLLPKEIVDQWRIVSARPGFRDKGVVQEKTCPYYCSAAGWIIVNHADEIQMEFGTKDYLYAKPCPIHRPQGVKIDPYAAPLKGRVVRPDTSDKRSHGVSTSHHVAGFESAPEIAESFDFEDELAAAD